MTIPPLTLQIRADCDKAAELAPHLSRAWSSFRSEDGRQTEIFVEGDDARDARPIMVLTEEASWADREFAVRATQLFHAVMTIATRRQAKINLLEAEIRRLKGEPESTEKSKAQWCAITCNNPAFKRWLAEVHGVETSDQERIASRVRSMLEISSRSELDNDQAAADRWVDMWYRFKAWEKHG